MNLKERLRNQLGFARNYSESLLDDFKTPQQWIYQVHEKANHALWFCGHIAVVDNFGISLLDAAKASEKAGYPEWFGMGSRPTSSLADYPPIEEVRGYMAERRHTLLGILEGLSEEDFDKPTPEGAPEFLPNYGAVFELLVWHEGLHAGQLSVVHRALGFPPKV